jgi:tetratricopeptide (TPR) repeat protein
MSFLCSIAYEKISAQNDIEIPPPQDIVNFLNQLDTDPPSEEKQKLGNSFTSRANSLSDQGRYEEALNTYMKALVADPTNYEAINSIGIILGEFERYEEAVKAYDKAIEVLKSQNPQDHDLVIMATNKAIDLTELGDYDNAMLSIDAALSINPNHADAYLYQGDILDRQGKYEEALEAYDKAIALDPNYVDAYNDKGESLSALGKYDEAELEYNKAISLSSSNTTNNMINEIKPNDIQPIVNTNVPVESLITQLKELTTLKQNNIITEEEFQHLKSMLIK